MTIIDVRSPQEYKSGHAPNSLNIPLQEIPDRLTELKSLPTPLVLCCASGYRSEQATNYLKKQGIDCENGGTWGNVKQHNKQV